jgi:hypothetical protein
MIDDVTCGCKGSGLMRPVDEDGFTADENPTPAEREERRNAILKKYRILYNKILKKD